MPFPAALSVTVHRFRINWRAMAILSVRPFVCLSICQSVRLWKQLCHSFFTHAHGSPIIPVLWVSNVFAKFRQSHLLRWR